MMMLSWDERGTLAPVSSEDELERLLDQVRDQAVEQGVPRMVTMLDGDDSSGPALSIGCGATASVAVWEFPDHGRPPLVSRGEGEAASTPVTFAYCGERTTYDCSSAIPDEQAREAMRAFFASGARPDNLAWRELSRAERAGTEDMA